MFTRPTLTQTVLALSLSLASFSAQADCGKFGREVLPDLCCMINYSLENGDLGRGEGKAQLSQQSPTFVTLEDKGRSSVTIESSVEDRAGEKVRKTTLWIDSTVLGVSTVSGATEQAESKATSFGWLMLPERIHGSVKSFGKYNGKNITQITAVCSSKAQLGLGE